MNDDRKILEILCIWATAIAMIAILILIGRQGIQWLRDDLLARLPMGDAVGQVIAERMVRPTTQIVDRHGNLLYEVLDPDHGKQLNLSLESVPQACIQATLATEDKRFYTEKIEDAEQERLDLDINDEKFAREQYYMKKSNEDVFIIEEKE